MIYKEYGKTGINISAIGFGGMRFAKPEDIDKSAEVVKAAYDAGINYFDTAPMYCADKSEGIFGTAIKEMLKTRKERPFYISTKSMKDKPEEVRKELERSLARLGVEAIDFYHVWCILNREAYENRKANGVLKEFEKLKDEGLIKNICVSTHMTGTDIGEMLADFPFAGVLLGYSVMNFAYRDKGLDAAFASGKGVVVMNPLGGGLIPQNPKLFDFIKTQQEETVVEGALRFLINDKRITSCIVGFSDTDQIAQAVKAAKGFKPISDDKIYEIRQSLRDSFNELCTGCRYCDKCPKGIPVPKMMDSYNIYKLSGKSIDMINKLRWHWGIGPEDEYITMCNECGICERACTQKLPIRKRLMEIREEVAKFLEQEKKKAENSNQ